MLKGALIGAGKIAQTGHLPAFADAGIRGRAALVAAVEPAAANRAALQRLLPEVRCYDTLEALLAAERLDFVDICTPPCCHAAQIEAAAGHGLGVLCEKPFCPTLAEASALHQRLVESCGFFVPCHQYRHSLLWREFKAELAASDGSSGALAQFNVLRMQADQGFDPSNPGWRTDAGTAGGGILADTGVHYIYLCLWMLGQPRTVSARTTRIRHTQLAVEDTAVVTLECERGTAVVTLTWAAATRHNSASLTTGAGTLLYDGTALARHRAGAVETLSVPAAADKAHYVGCYVALFDEFLGQLERREPGRAGLDEALQTVAVLDACYRSAATGQTVRLDP